MFLSQITIKNFRGIKSLDLNLDDTTVLIGENNTGKSTILDALQYCLTRSLGRKNGAFTEYDYHLTDENSDPTKANPIEIILYFNLQEENESSDDIEQQFSDYIQTENELRKIILCVKHEWRDNAFKTTWDFLDLDANPLPRVRNSPHLSLLQQFVPVFYLSALRDAAKAFDTRSPFWKPFIRSLKLSPEMQVEFEDALSTLNQKVLDAHESFSAVKDKLNKTHQYVSLGSNDPVTIEAIPRKIFDMLSRTQVMLTAKTGVRLPIGLHGEGTQSLAVICLFDAFLEAKLTEEYTQYTVPILALEEPEAHLHPAAIRAVTKMLQQLNGQKVITTHSGELVAGVPLEKLRRLSRKNGEITVYQLKKDALTKDELHKLNYHVRLTRGNLLFARCWLLVEGETEFTIFNECARIMGIDLFARGVCCVEYAQVGVEKFIKLADQLGIEWLMVADNDREGNKYIESAKEQLADRNQNQHCYQLEYGDIEVFFCMNRYGSIFEKHRSEKKKKSDNNIHYWKYVLKTLHEEEEKSCIIKAIKKLLSGEQPTEQLTRILEMGKDILLTGTTEEKHDDRDLNGKGIEYWKKVVKERSNNFSKPQAALAIVEEIEKPNSAGVPQQIKDIINQAISLAEQSA